MEEVVAEAGERAKKGGSLGMRGELGEEEASASLLSLPTRTVWSLTMV